MFSAFYAGLTAAADLAQAADRLTPWIPARGARCVMFHWIGGAGTPQVAGTSHEGSNLDPIVAGGSGQSLTPGSFASALVPTTVHPLNVAGGMTHTLYPATVGGYIQTKYVRMTIRGTAAAGPITGVQFVGATVIYDGDSAPTGTGTAAV